MEFQWNSSERGIRNWNSYYWYDVSYELEERKFCIEDF